MLLALDREAWSPAGIASVSAVAVDTADARRGGKGGFCPLLNVLPALMLVPPDSLRHREAAGLVRTEPGLDVCWVSP